LICPHCKRHITPLARIERLLAICAVRCGTTTEEMRSESRSTDIVRARRLFCRDARAMGYSLTRIGQTLHRHHTSVLYLLS
jgi:chromosomal replication initiation ATPase DnaA